MGMKTGVLMALLLSSTLTLTFNIQPAKTSGDLVGYWKFDEGSGTTAYDSSGNGNDGILINGPVWTAGKVDGALRFDGIDDIVVVPDSASLDITQEIVIAMWVRPFSIPSVAVRLIEKTDYWGPYQVEFAEGLKPRFHILGAGHTANSAISLDEWNFLAFTYNGTNKRIYINGLLDLDLLVTGHLTTDDNPVTIGGSLAYSFTFFDGIIDDVRIYNRALSEEEIRAIMDMDVHDVAITNVILSKTIVDQGYNTDINVIAANQGNYQETFDVTLYAEPVINETGLVGYWNFDEGTGTTAYDSSGNNNHGTLVNGPTWVDGKIGKALSFDGIDDYVEVLDSASLNVNAQITITAWIKMDSVYNGTSGQRFIIDKNDGGSGYWFWIRHEPYRHPSLRLDFSDYMNGDPIPFGEWHHVVATYNGSTVTFYEDGQPFWGGNRSSPISNCLENLLIGNGWANWGQPPPLLNGFDGIIDEVKIYNRALSADEIWAEYARLPSSPIVIQTQTVTLESGASTTLTFNWNTTGFTKGNYIISAYAWLVPGETDLSDNTFFDGSIYVAMLGDITTDGIVDIFDLVPVALAFNSKPGDSNWNSVADINNDYIVDIFDIVIVALHFGEVDP